MKDKVLCLVTAIDVNIDDIWDQHNWIDYEPRKKVNEDVLPLINHLHSDRENGQDMPHYHVDDRYEINMTSFPIRVFPHLMTSNQTLEYRILTIKNKTVKSITPPIMISKSKLKHKCIHKGKCPHRGFDLSKEQPGLDGMITCPLHGLKFKNGQLVNQ